MKAGTKRKKLSSFKTSTNTSRDGRCHEGKEEEKEEEKRIIVHHSSWNCSFSRDWRICWSCVFVGGPLLAPTPVASATDAAPTCFWACRAQGRVRCFGTPHDLWSRMTLLPFWLAGNEFFLTGPITMKTTLQLGRFPCSLLKSLQEPIGRRAIQQGATVQYCSVSNMPKSVDSEKRFL
jgi:hypothetical protein